MLFRFLAWALAASTLLHAVLVWLPSLGRPEPAGPSALHGEHSPYTLNAVLANGGRHQFAPETVQPEGDPAARTRLTPLPGTPGGAERAGVGAGLVPIPAATFYASTDLTRRPQPLAPLDLGSQATVVANGAIVMSLWITDAGTVRDVQVEKSDLPPMVTGAVVAAFRRMAFTPGERDGVAVGSVLRVAVDYDGGKVISLPPTR